jgi:hypothetical protein
MENKMKSKRNQPGRIIRNRILSSRVCVEEGATEGQLRTLIRLCEYIEENGMAPPTAHPIGWACYNNFRMTPYTLSVSDIYWDFKEVNK